MLSKEQIQTLKKMAQALKAHVHVGKGGLNEGTLQNVAEQLQAHELTKVQVLQNAEMSPKDLGPILAQSLKADLVQVIGRVIILYKAREKDPKIRF